MWISRKKWTSLISRIEKCEKEQRKLKEELNISILKIAKKILEQPQELLEDLNSIEKIEKMINDFIHS